MQSGPGAERRSSRAARRRWRRVAALRPVAAASLVVLALVLLAACGGSSGGAATAVTPSPSETPQRGGEFVVPLETDPESLAPFSTGDLAHLEIEHQVFEGLVAYERLEGGGYATVPCLAESWTANADATAWTFRLRRGVRFQPPVDREVTAHDVVACFRYGAAARTESFHAYMNVVIAGTDDEGHATPADLGVRALDTYTVRFTLKSSFAAFADTLGTPYAWIWPVDELRRVGRRQFERRPVGTGPYVCLRHTRGEAVELARNPAWWDAASGRPFVDRVKFVVYPSVSSRQLAFQRGAVDCTWVQIGQAAAARELPQVKDGEWDVRRLPVFGTLFLGFDMQDPVVGGPGGLPVRRAVDCCVDRRALVAETLEGVPVPQTGLVPPLLAGWADTAPAQSYDPALARRLYDEAGRPPLTLGYPDVRMNHILARWLRSSCSAAGLDLRLRPMDPEEMYGSFTGDRRPSLFMTGWLADFPSADSFLYALFHSTQSRYTSGTAYRDADVDRLLSLARAEADPARQYSLNLRAAREIQADVPVIPLYVYTDLRLVRAAVGGFDRGPLGWTDMWRVWVR